MPLQTHIRSPLLTAAPISRLRRARAQEGGTILFFGFLSQAKFRSAHLDPPEPIRPRKIEKVKALFSGGRCLGSFKDNAGSHIFPEGDQQLSRQGNDQYFPNSATIELYALTKPQGQYRTGLMPYPQPGELDHGCSQPRVSGFGDALFVSDGSAPPGRRRQSGIRGNLPSVGKASEQSLRPQDTGEFRTNPLQTL
jgi:hypothetical protein